MKFDETPNFWYPRVALNAWMNFASCSDEILRFDFRRSEKETKIRKNKNISLFYTLSLSPFFTFLFDFFGFYLLFIYLFIIIIIIIILDTWFISLHSGSFLLRNNLFIFNSLYIK